MVVRFNCKYLQNYELITIKVDFNQWYFKVKFATIITLLRKFPSQL